MNPLAPIFVPCSHGAIFASTGGGKTSRLTECFDTYNLVVALSLSNNVSPMMLRATSQELCVTATPEFYTELFLQGLRKEATSRHMTLCVELLDYIPKDIDITLYANGEEVYITPATSA